MYIQLYICTHFGLARHAYIYIYTSGFTHAYIYIYIDVYIYIYRLTLLTRRSIGFVSFVTHVAVGPHGLDDPPASSRVTGVREYVFHT